jgi:hypothetical protein
MRRALLGCLLCLYCFPLGHAADLSIKITGGLKYGLFGDVNKGMNGYLDVWADGGESQGGDIVNRRRPLHFGASYSLDFIFKLDASYSVAVGVGFIRKRNISEIMILYPDERPDETASVDMAVETAPIRFSLFRNLQLHRALNTYFMGGIEIYLPRFQSYYWPAGPGDSHRQKAHSIGAGLLCGAGMEYKAFSRLAFIVEVVGNYAKISHFKGTRYSGGSTLPHEENGMLYFYNIQRDHALLFIHEIMPTGDNARMARVDFSGFAVSGGIRVYF